MDSNGEKTGAPFKVAKTSLVYHTQPALERSPDKKTNFKFDKEFGCFCRI